MDDSQARMIVNELRTLNRTLKELAEANQRQVSKLDDIASQIRRK